MARRKTLVKRRFKRKRKKKRSKPSLTISRWGPMADRHRCKLRYSSTISLAIGTFPTYAFNANSIYDPDRTGVGTQPMGHDEFSVFYNRYVVLNATCTVSFGSAAALSNVSLAAVNSNTLPTSYEQMTELSRAKSSVVPALANQTGKRKLKVSCNLNKLYGRLTAYDDRVQADFGSNPQETAMFILGMQHVDTVSTTSAYAQVEIIYDTILFDRSLLSRS